MHDKIRRASGPKNTKGRVVKCKSGDRLWMRYPTLNLTPMAEKHGHKHLKLWKQWVNKEEGDNFYVGDSRVPQETTYIVVYYKEEETNIRNITSSKLRHRHWKKQDIKPKFKHKTKRLHTCLRFESRKVVRVEITLPCNVSPSHRSVLWILQCNHFNEVMVQAKRVGKYGRWMPRASERHLTLAKMPNR